MLDSAVLCPLQEWAVRNSAPFPALLPAKYQVQNVEQTLELATDCAGLKPLDVMQPEGPSFSVNGNEVSWQKWNFRVSFNYREGLVLHNVGCAPLLDQSIGPLHIALHWRASRSLVSPATPYIISDCSLGSWLSNFRLSNS